VESSTSAKANSMQKHIAVFIQEQGGDNGETLEVFMKKYKGNLKSLLEEHRNANHKSCWKTRLRMILTTKTR
jgi:hypothetical protein